jgi:hypothetical protein
MTQEELDALPDVTNPGIGQAEQIIDGKRVVVPVFYADGPIFIGPEDGGVTDAAGQRWLVGRCAGGMRVKRRLS